MKILFVLIVVVSAVSVAFGQADVHRVIAAERAFAKLAADKGTKFAFLANMADDAVVFTPEKTPAKPVWLARKDSSSLLEWAPNFAEISLDGKIGFTTGNWQYRPKGKSDEPVAFGEFNTIWQRQADGEYKWIIDIGVSHDRPAAYALECAVTKMPANAKGSRASLDTAVDGFRTAAASDPGRAVEKYAGDEIRVFHENKMPAIGRSAAIADSKSVSRHLSLDADAKAVGSGGLAYVLTSYKFTSTAGETEKGNLLEVWKSYAKGWKLLAQVYAPVASK